MIKQTQLTIVLFIILIAFSCKKDKTPSPASTSSITATNQSLIKSNSTEYIIADIEGINGSSKLNLQDGNGIVFARYYNHCPVSMPFTLMQANYDTANPNNETVSFLFYANQMCTTFKEPITTGIYTTNNITLGNVGVMYTHPNVNANGQGSSIDNFGTNNTFEITKIETINGIEYASGSFSVKMLLPPNWNSSFWFKNGIFRFKTQ